MDGQMEAIKKNIKLEEDKIEKLQKEIVDFKERKNKDIIAAKNRILNHKQRLLKFK